MTLTQLDQIVSLCQSQADRYRDESPELDSFLAQYLVTSISGIYEETIEEAIRSRVSRVNDEALLKLVTNLVHASFRNPDSDTIKALLKKFGQTANSRFIAKAKEEDLQALNSIINNKNAVAHGKDSPVTMKDICSYYPKSKNIIILVGEILNTI